MDKATQRDIFTVVKALIAVFGIKKGAEKGVKKYKEWKKKRKDEKTMEKQVEKKNLFSKKVF